MSQDYCVEEEEHKCEGCIYSIVGERKDKQGYILKTQACVCEEEMAASCLPTYQFSPPYIFKGKWHIRKDKEGLIFRHNGKLLPNVTLNANHDTKKDKV